MTEAVAKMVSQSGIPNIPNTREIGLGSRDEVVKVRVTVLRASASTGKLIKAESEVMEQHWDVGPMQFGLGLSTVCAHLAKRVWPMPTDTPSE